MWSTRVIGPNPWHGKLNGASTGAAYAAVNRAAGALWDKSLVDILSLALTHGLMAVALWRLLQREDLDRDAGDVAAPGRPWSRKQAVAADEGD